MLPRHVSRHTLLALPLNTHTLLTIESFAEHSDRVTMVAFYENMQSSVRSLPRRCTPKNSALFLFVDLLLFFLIAGKETTKSEGEREEAR